MSDIIVVIVESPSKCKKIEQYLNKTNLNNSVSYRCLASCGHIRELSGLESIDIHHNFAPTFIECESKKKQIIQLKKAAKAAKEVIIASDDDREGESIAWHLCEVLNLPLTTTKRIIFHEITEAALKRAIEEPVYINMHIVNAQLARQVLDLLVGYKISPFLWKHVKDGLSAGRCQTPALRLIYDNQKEIEANPGKQTYTISGVFTNLNLQFVLNYKDISNENISNENISIDYIKTFLNESLSYDHIFNDIKLRQSSRAPPLPFTTSTVQQAASNELHISPKETMQLCQTLYEEGFITYHRTDSILYSSEFREKINVYINQNYGETYITEVKVISHTNAHEAIRPTDITCTSVTFPTDTDYNRKAKRLYQLIWVRALESCLPPANVSVLTASISAPCNNEYRFTTEQLIFAGWKIVKGESVNNEYNYLKTIKSGQILPYKKVKAEMRLKEVKTHYTEARLVQLLEECGIGRPSTFSSLVEKIQERKYVKKTNVKGKVIQCYDMEISPEIPKQIISIQTDREFGNEKHKLIIQPVGIIALDFLLKYFDTFFNYSYTKQMEDDLDLVSKGEKIWYEVCQKCNSEMDNLSSLILEKGKETIRIDKDHTYMVGKYGPVIKYFDGNQTSFKIVRDDIDLDKLRRGEYSVNELVESIKKPLGEYQNHPVFIKVGKFGIYLEWNGLTKSLKHLKKESLNEIKWSDVEELLIQLETPDTSVLRIINDAASIRQSKHGHYIYYKTDRMKKPRFLKLAGFKDDYLKCELEQLQEWFNDTYIS
jgi:DNA topoisomerase-1